MTYVKICGIASPEEARSAAELGADLLGLVFHPGSRRCLTVERARAVAEALGGPRRWSPVSFEDLSHLVSPAAWFQGCARALEALLERRRPLLVGVFVNSPAAEVDAIAEACGLDLVQLSGDEDWEYCRSLSWPAIKALRLGPEAPAQALTETIPAGAAPLLLLDSHVPGLYGGTGVPLDWRVAGELARRFPIMLAGGLNPENVAQAVRQVRPWAVDVSSGGESEGRKDMAKIRAFVREAKLALVG